MRATHYLERLPFPADRFQADAAGAFDRGESVVVAAPTGSGKTVVAEAAIASVLSGGRRAVYTTPIKALSNQKFGDFRDRYGSNAVGLLTGDNSINGDASIVVMTTEVLRNMMYAGSPDLADLGVVILDEVHYLQDRTRGAVWEEIIIHLDRSIPLVCLSATVPNAAEFREWVAGLRGPTALVTETERPVPLDSTYLVRDRWESGRLRHMDLFEADLPNSALLRMLGRNAGRRRFGTPHRFETCEKLARDRMLPAIYFIFSRAACSAAAHRVVDMGLRLTSAEESARIREVAEERTGHLDAADLGVLGYGRWLGDLEAGVAPHHAGLVPAFKETAEALFAAGLVKVVFATETLALGINMPARTVVLESLSKFTGEGHELLTPGDYTQLTGRAGRRGIDDHGTAVVLHSPYVSVEEVTGVAAPGARALRSSFRATYNMAVNLIASYDREEAETLLEASFARFREARRREDVQRRIADGEARLEILLLDAVCERGDIWEALGDQSKAARLAMERLATATTAGNVLEWEERGASRRYVLAARGTGKRPRLLLISDDARLVRLGPERLPEDAAVVGRIDLPTPFRPRDPKYRRRVAESLRSWTPTAPPARPHLPVDDPVGVASCPDLQAHLRAAREARRLQKTLERERRRLQGLAAGVVPRFHEILRILERWGCVRGWSLTPAGERLRTIYNELDLLLGESLERGLLDGLDAAEVAAVASLFTYEPRRADDPGTLPTRRCADRAERVAEMWDELAQAESRAGLTVSRMPEAGFAGIAYRWASGEGLESLFAEDAVGVGDFVRNCRQLIDLLRQIRDAAPRLRDVVENALDAVDRGVVAAVGVT